MLKCKSKELNTDNNTLNILHWLPQFLKCVTLYSGTSCHKYNINIIFLYSPENKLSYVPWQARMYLQNSKSCIMLTVNMSAQSTDSLKVCNLLSGHYFHY